MHCLVVPEIAEPTIPANVQKMVDADRLIRGPPQKLEPQDRPSTAFPSAEHPSHSYLAVFSLIVVAEDFERHCFERLDLVDESTESAGPCRVERLECLFVGVFGVLVVAKVEK